MEQEELEHESSFRKLGSPVEHMAADRLDKFLANHYPFFARNQWQKRIDDKLVLVNARTTKCTYLLKPGDQITYFFPQEKEPEVATNLKILWEHAGVMAVFKPAPLPMHEGGPYRKNTFYTLLNQLTGSTDWSAIHRLDRETSGVVLCGGNDKIRQRLSTMMRAHEIEKTYYAICNGLPQKKQWTVNAPIDDLKQSQIRIKKWVVDGGQSAITEFRSIATSGNLCLLRAKPKTGRTNQIRIHAAYSGHLLVGDKLYHPDENVFLEFFKDGNTDNVISKAGFHRHCLHAAQLKFRHPETRQKSTVSAPFPEDMRRLWRNDE